MDRSEFSTLETLSVSTTNSSLDAHGITISTPLSNLSCLGLHTGNNLTFAIALLVQAPNLRDLRLDYLSDVEPIIPFLSSSVNSITIAFPFRLSRSSVPPTITKLLHLPSLTFLHIYVDNEPHPDGRQQDEPVPVSVLEHLEQQAVFQVVELKFFSHLESSPWSELATFSY